MKFDKVKYKILQLSLSRLRDYRIDKDPSEKDLGVLAKEK